jgi:hypothetical protein
MKARTAIAIACTGIALAACPREPAPMPDAAVAAAPATLAPAASIATPASTTLPRANEPKLPPQTGRVRGPPPEPDPLIPPPPVDE